MYTKHCKLMVASGIALAMVAVGGRVVAGTTSQEVIEARQETQIWTTYALSPYLRANDLQVTVHEGKATLTGTVEEGVDKALAKQIALGVSGIHDVDNQIVVKPDYVHPARPAERSFGEVIDDASITTAIKSKLLWSRHTEGLSIDVDTTRGRVTLKGTADSLEAKDLARRMALNTHGVVSVDNQLVVSDAKPTMANAGSGSAHEAEREVSDSWITSKVKSTFLYSKNVDGSDIEVSTKSGIVTLSGKVDSGAERELAIELAKNVRGVNDVTSRQLTL